MKWFERSLPRPEEQRNPERCMLASHHAKRTALERLEADRRAVLAVRIEADQVAAPDLWWRKARDQLMVLYLEVRAGCLNSGTLCYLFREWVPRLQNAELEMVLEHLLQLLEHDVVVVHCLRRALHAQPRGLPVDSLHRRVVGRRPVLLPTEPLLAARRVLQAVP